MRKKEESAVIGQNKKFVAKKKKLFAAKHLSEKMEKIKMEQRKEIIITWSRASIIIPSIVGHTIRIHNGKEHMPFYITDFSLWKIKIEMGRYFYFQCFFYNNNRKKRYGWRKKNPFNEEEYESEDFYSYYYRIEGDESFKKKGEDILKNVEELKEVLSNYQIESKPENVHKKIVHILKLCKEEYEIILARKTLLFPTFDYDYTYDSYWSDSVWKSINQILYVLKFPKNSYVKDEEFSFLEILDPFFKNK